MVLELRLALKIANTYVYKPESIYIYIYTYMPDSMSMPIHEWNLW